MNFKKTMFTLAIGSVGVMGAMSAHATAVNNGDTLTIDAGAGVYTTIPGVGTFLTGYTGSWFGMDTNNDGITANEKTALSATNSPGLVIGQSSVAGPYGNGLSTVGSAGPIVDTWGFFSSAGTNFVTNAAGVTGSTEAGLDMSGWAVAWNNVPYINMGAGAAATFAWDGVYDHAYTLDYSASVPSDSPAFPGVFYQLHLEGTVTQAVPEASTYGMMLAGLGLVGFAVRRRKATI